MTKRSVRAAALTLCLLAASGAYAFDVTSTQLHLFLSGLKTARAPIVVEDHLVLSAAGTYRFVGAAFSTAANTAVGSFALVGARLGVRLLLTHWLTGELEVQGALTRLGPAPVAATPP